jgi:hypothetical protein
MSVREARDTCRFFAGCTGLRTVAGCAIRRGAALKRFHSRNARLLVLYQPTIFSSLSLTTARLALDLGVQFVAIGPNSVLRAGRGNGSAVAAA